MERLLKVFEYNGEKYEIMLVERLEGTYFLKDFKKGVPFSPFYYCVNNLGFIDISDIEVEQDHPVMNFLISQSEQGVRHWADYKDLFLERAVAFNI